MINNILYLTYDGINDPLGQSQIAPYIEGIAEQNFNFHIISFEKKHSKTNYDFKNNFVINWKKYKFTKRLFYFGKIYDYFRFLAISMQYTRKNNIHCIHARGFITGFVALLIFKLFKTKYIYDSRGLWVDERLDNNSLNKKNLISNLVYNILKIIEKKIFFNANEVIVLTFKVKKYLSLNNYCKINYITVIPCAADYDKFKLYPDISLLKKKFNINSSSFIISYNGSITGVYLFEEMLKIFEKINFFFKNSYFLVITNNVLDANKILLECNQKIKKNVIIVNATRDEMPKYLSLSDVDFFMINPTFARTASFPTKLSESFAMNKVVICNSGIGDVDFFLNKYKLGKIIKKYDVFNKFYFLRTYLQIINTNNNRSKTHNFFDLKVAIKRYKRVYSKIFKYENSFN